MPIPPFLKFLALLWAKAFAKRVLPEARKEAEKTGNKLDDAAVDVAEEVVCGGPCEEKKGA